MLTFLAIFVEQYMLLRVVVDPKRLQLSFQPLNFLSLRCQLQSDVLQILVLHHHQLLGGVLIWFFNLVVLPFLEDFHKSPNEVSSLELKEIVVLPTPRASS